MCVIINTIIKNNDDDSECVQQSGGMFMLQTTANCKQRDGCCLSVPSLWGGGRGLVGWGSDGNRVEMWEKQKWRKRVFSPLRPLSVWGGREGAELLPVVGNRTTQTTTSTHQENCIRIRTEAENVHVRRKLCSRDVDTFLSFHNSKTLTTDTQILCHTAPVLVQQLKSVYHCALRFITKDKFFRVVWTSLVQLPNYLTSLLIMACKCTTQ